MFTVHIIKSFFVLELDLELVLIVGPGSKDD